MEMKVCNNSKCFFVGKPQSLENFGKDKAKKDGLDRRCKNCKKQYCVFHKEEAKRYRAIHKEKTKQYHKEYYTRNKEEVQEQHQQYYRQNKKESQERSKQYYQQNKEQIQEYNKQYYGQNKEEILQNQNQYQNLRKKEDVNYKIKCYLRTRIYNAIKNNLKSGSAVADLMMSISNFKLYLEERWYPDPDTGEMMSWLNYGKGWHIDHVIPLSAFDLTDRQQFLKAVHYSNLRPMWAKQNISESDRGMSRSRQNMQNNEVKNI